LPHPNPNKNKIRRPAVEWTAERIALLKRLRDDGVSYAAIAAKLGITRGAVSGKVDRLGLATREPMPRGPRRPRAVLKIRPVAPRASDPDPEVQRACGAPFNRDTREERVPPVEGLGEGRPGRTSQEAADHGPADPSARASRACSLLELTEDTCRWPVGDVGEPGFFFCGEPPLAGAPYCGPHCRKAYRPFDTRPLSEFVPDRDAVRVVQPDTRFGQFAHWDVT
jgi:GcrA cell cycle regulator